VCRCGAGATAELIQNRLPAVLIPYPFAHDHQRKNGEFIQKGARLLLQKEASPQRLAAEIEQLRAHLEEHKKALSEISFPKTTNFGELVRTIGERK
jgi:UDP-N-acetylglucosamine--N-acetylmuramyl-(pentapeptide) pyrophosphoryl-undecaprenol N-acetylglucosamine transferase